MDNKALVLIGDNRNNFFPDETENALVKELYLSETKLSRIMRKGLLMCHVPLYPLFFTDWYKSDCNPGKIILFETGNAKYIIPIIKRKYPDARLILWFWNSVDRTIKPKDVIDEKVELWSFDPDDCKKYDMSYNTQFFSKHCLKNISRGDLRQDVFFVGNDKGRIEQLTELKATFDKYGISYDFHIVGDTAKDIPKWNCKYRRGLKYKEVLERDFASKAIVDIVASGQHGLTLRPLEAMFLKKKLITNFACIKEYNFYDKNNIFIFGEDNEKNLLDFINSPYSTTFNESYYEMYNWVQRF